MNVPTEIIDSEKTARTIFSPANLNKKKTGLNNNVYRSPKGIDEVSVNRISLTSSNHCKLLGKKNENPENRRSYLGFGILDAFEIRRLESDVVSSPIMEPVENINEFHADIKVGHVCEIGAPMPSEISQRTKKLAKSSRFYIDPNPESTNWEGDKLL